MQSPRNLRQYEPLLLFSLVFLPGYLSQTLSAVNGDLFNDAFLMVFYLFTAVPQTLLILYLICRDGFLPPEVYGLVAPDGKTLLRTLPALGGIFPVLIPVYLLNLLLYLAGVSVPWETVEWQFRNPALIPLVLLVCLATGYLEESYFRVYLTTRMDFAGVPRSRSLLLVNLLFASGHLYQGLPGFAGTLVIGLYLTRLFYSRRNIHLIAITHGLYNFTVLLLSFLLI